MNKSEFIKKFKVGDKISKWSDESNTTIIAIGNHRIFCRDDAGDEDSWDMEIGDHEYLNWRLYKEPQKMIRKWRWRYIDTYFDEQRYAIGSYYYTETEAKVIYAKSPIFEKHGEPIEIEQ